MHASRNPEDIVFIGALNTD